MFDIKTAAIDKHALDGGKVFKLTDDGTASITLRSRRHPDYKTRRDQHSFRIFGGRGKVTAAKLEQMTAVTNRLVGEHCIVAWEGVQNGGTDLPFSTENAVTLMTEPQYEPFQEFILGLLDELDASFTEFEADIAGN